ncbi:MAG: glycosyltransferase family 39 protein [Actinomycetota bacterium]
MSIDERELTQSGSEVLSPSVGQAASAESAALAESMRAAGVSLSVRVERLDELVGALTEAGEQAGVSTGHVVRAARSLAAAGGAPIPRGSVDEIVLSEPHPAVLEADHLVRVRVAEIRRRVAAGSTVRRREGLSAGTLTTVGLATLGWFATVQSGVVPSDAVSRVQGALAVIAGRDPHPESIGFIWGPFPTLFQSPLLLFRQWWPDLASRSFAAVIVSAICVGIVVAQMLALGRDLGSPRWTRYSVVGLTLASPLLLLYGANGMSEACWMAALMVAVRQLALWARTDRITALVVAGVALGVAYLTRYETAASALGALVFVVAVSASRRPGDDGWSTGTVGGALGRSSRRMREILLDAAILSFPIGAAVLGWSLVSFLIVGEPLAQLSSEYGNSALVRAAEGVIAETIGDTSVIGRVWFYLQQVFTAAPLILPLTLVTLWVGGRRAVMGCSAMAVLGAPVLLQLLLAGSGGTFPWFRYVICAAMLSSTLALVLTGSGERGGSGLLRPLAVACLVPGLVLSWTAVTIGDLGARDDQLMIDGLGTVWDGGVVDERNSVIARGESVAAAIDEIDGVVPGAVVTDASSTFAVISAAPRPEVYVIPSDRDFLAVVADPAAFGVRFALLRLPSSAGDSLVAQHPGLTSNQDRAFGALRTFGEDGDDAGRYVLYRVVNPRGEPRPTPDEGFIN